MISVVAAIFNEEKIVSELILRLEKALGAIDKDYEVILVDDGSRDSTVDIVMRANARNPKIKLIQFSRNFGQVYAIRAGLRYSKGDITVLMDGDLQDQPEEIPKLIEKMNEGYDVVYACRSNRQDSLYRRVGSRVFVILMRFLIPENELPAGHEMIFAGVFRALRRDVVDALNSLPERTVYIQGLIHWVGFSKALVDVRHGKRAYGKSNWTFSKLFQYALDALISFSPYPLRKISIFGMVMAFGSGLLGIGYFLQRLFIGTRSEGFTTIVLLILFIGGLQLFLFGVIGEYVGRMYIESKGRPLYIIKRKFL